jgi:hypothetical protein
MQRKEQEQYAEQTEVCDRPTEWRSKGFHYQAKAHAKESSWVKATTMDTALKSTRQKNSKDMKSGPPNRTWKTSATRSSRSMREQQTMEK